ncbi:MAG: hypothetical protein U9R25_18650 [Chloroflexota bacterium]|nr:hypothetical protein [Chloroflexota bacterium]
MSIEPDARQNPYPGPRSFRKGETLYGRSRETRELLDLLIAERILLLYSPSGAGKTSLIQAALIPELEQEGFRVLPPMRPGLEPPEQSAATQTRFIASLLSSLEKELESNFEFSAGSSLEDALTLLSSPEEGWGGDVLIFDQFEEVLTIDPADLAAKSAFFQQIGQVLRDRQRWALFAIREEFIAGLDPYRRFIPTRFAATYRLEPLDRTAAMQAMQAPAEMAGVTFTDEAASQLADDLRLVRVQLPDGSTKTVPGRYVEPVQLQVVCRRLWNGLSPTDTTIDVDDVATVGDVDDALRSYYAETVAAVSADMNVRERVIRDWVDANLITGMGIRGQVLMGATESKSLDNNVIWRLVGAHLVRAEQRRGATWFELAHDRLIDPVVQDNTAWRVAHLSALQRQAALWNAEGRPDGLLLQGDALEESEHWARDHEDALLDYETDFLSACIRARSQREQEQRLARRMRWLAISAALFALFATIAAFQAWNQSQAANQARQETEAALFVSETAEAKAQVALQQAQEAQETAQAERDRAQEQARIALSRKIAADAQTALGAGQDGILLSVGAWQVTDTAEARNTVSEALATWRGRGILGPHERQVRGAQFSPDGQLVATSARDTVHLWEIDGEHRTLALRGHTEDITDLAWSPDGTFVATAGRDGTGRLWDAETGRELWQIPVPGGAMSLAFHPDGHTIAFGAQDGPVLLNQVPTGEEIVTLPKLGWGFPVKMHFSPDGESLAAAYSDDAARIWRGDQVTELKGHGTIVWDVAWSPDGRQLVSLGNDDTLRLWDVETGEQLAVTDDGRELEHRVWFSPDGRYVTATSRARVAYLWDLADPEQPLHILPGHAEAVTMANFSPDGKQLATASFDGSSILWDVETRSQLARLTGHTERLWWASFSPDGRFVITTSDDATARLWDANAHLGGELAARAFSRPVRFAGYSPGGDAIVALHENRLIHWNLSNGDEVDLEIDQPDMPAAAVTPSGDALAVADHQGTVRLWNPATGMLLWEIPAQNGTLVHDLAFDPAGEILALARQDGTVELWNVDSGQRLDAQHVHSRDTYAVAFSPDGNWLASGGADATIGLWEWRSGAARKQLRTTSGVFRDLAFSPDGRLLAAADDNTGVLVWDMETPDSWQMKLAVDTPVRDMAFGPDSETLALAHESGNITLVKWRVGARTTLLGHQGWVESLAFSPDGQTLLSAGHDGTVRVWPATTEGLVELACQRVDGSARLGEMASGPLIDPEVEICPESDIVRWIESERMPQPGPPVDSSELLPQPELPIIYYFEAHPHSSIEGERAITLIWHGANAREIHLHDPAKENTGVTSPDTRQIAPLETTEYRLEVKNDQGTVERILTVTRVDNE